MTSASRCRRTGEVDEDEDEEDEDNEGGEARVEIGGGGWEGGAN